ncbi:MAG TPA: peptidoglycan-binding protein LysM [Bacteroidetes bacterium]|nr:peptidoglycan-binding protein LysM [Bacteroidota bacterium]
MGIFDFVRNAGKEKVESNKSEQMSQILAKKLEDYGLEVKDVAIQLTDGVITVQGEAIDQATREKVVMALGNLNGVSQVDDQMTLPVDYEAAHAEPTFYTVVSGDSLSKIAKRQYGDAMKYPVIFEANKPMLKDVNKIYPGQVLRIPELEA